MSVRSEQHAFFLQMVMDQMACLVRRRINRLTITTPVGIGTVTKVRDFLDNGKHTNDRIYCSRLGPNNPWTHSLDYHMRQFDVVVMDEWDLLPEPMRAEVEWSIRRHPGGIVRMRQASRGLEIGNIAIG